MRRDDMPSSKKPRKAYRPKLVRSSAIADALAAHVPMATDKQQDILICANQALAALRTGAGTESDAEMLAVAMNLCMLLCEAKIGDEYLAYAIAGQEAVARCKARSKRLGKWGLDGEGLDALRTALELHEQQMELATQRQVSLAMAELHRRARAGHLMECT